MQVPAARSRPSATPAIAVGRRNVAPHAKHLRPTLPRLPASLLTLLALPTRCCSSLRPSLTQRTAPFVRVSESPANQVRASGRRQRRFGISVATSQRRYRAAQWSFDSEGIFFFQRYRIALHCIASPERRWRCGSTQRGSPAGL